MGLNDEKNGGSKSCENWQKFTQFFLKIFYWDFHIFKYVHYYNIENWAWLCCLGLELGLLCLTGPIFSSLELVLYEPYPGKAALVRPQKCFRPLG